jgi:cytochrome c553
MTRSRGPFKLDNPWVRIGWLTVVGLVTVGMILGFGVLGREQQNGRTLDLWAGICRGLGLSADPGPANEPQPPLRTPTRITWTRATLAQVAGGDLKRGEFVAMNCTACHGEQGVSRSGLYPTLAGMDAANIYKQLDDFRASKRSWGAMNGIAQVISAEASADVAAFFASRTASLYPLSLQVGEAGVKRLTPNVREHFQTGRSVGEQVPAERLALVGDPARGIPPCSACHGPAGSKLGAPALKGQQRDYIERQLAAFAQGIRQNDMNRQMRTIATQLGPEERRAIADYYGNGACVQIAGR